MEDHPSELDFSNWLIYSEFESDNSGINMVTRKKAGQIWHEAPSGLYIPDGNVSDIFLSSTQSFLELKDKARMIEDIFAESNVPLPLTSDLAKAIEDTKTLSDSWLLGKLPAEWRILIHRMLLLSRVADAIIPLSNVPGRSKYLSTLISGNLEHFSKRSEAKDIFWELEIWSVLKRRGLTADLLEPPDIVVGFENAKIGIACKKFYQHMAEDHTR